MMNQMYQSDQLTQMSQANLLHFINIVSFQVMDLTLFLDSHPSDKEALQQFNYYSELRNKALKVYEEKFAPLTIDTTNSDCYWTWIKEPWPWEGGNC